MPVKTEEFVTMKTCTERYHLGRWIFGLLFALMAVFLTMTVYALDSSRRVKEEMDHVHRLVERHVATSTEANKGLRDRLELIKTDVRETREMLMKVLHERASAKVVKDER